MKKALLALLCAGFLLLGGCGPRTSLGEAPSESEPLKNGESSLPESEPKEDSDVLDGDGFYVQEYTIHVAPPIYPQEGKSITENTEYMKEANYRIWKQIYEETYQTPLQYTCRE